jgi:hypothetical protein
MKDHIGMASEAHQRIMINLALFHLLLPVIALGSGYIIPLLGLAFLGSLVSIGWIAWHAKWHRSDNPFVQYHWKLAWRRCRGLLIAYALALCVMTAGFLLSLVQVDTNMAAIILVVFSRIAAVPVVLMVLVLFVLETGALAEAKRGAMSNG